jgi:ComF family protein
LEIAAPHCGACLKREPPYAAAWAPFRYAHPLNLLEARFKFHGDLAAGRVLAELMIDRARQYFAASPTGNPEAGHEVEWSRPHQALLPNLLLCVPLHTERLRERGYNQTLELAKPLAKALHIPLDARALIRTRSTSAQTRLDAKARRRNLRDAFALKPGIALPAHVAILDDVMTTGTTLRECARVLRRAGVERVDVWALARAPQRR